MGSIAVQPAIDVANVPQKTPRTQREEMVEPEDPDEIITITLNETPTNIIFELNWHGSLSLRTHKVAKHTMSRHARFCAV